MDIAKLLFEICLWKKTPQDIPYSLSLFYLVISAFVVTSFLLLYLSADALSALLQVVTELLFSLCFIYLVLSLTGKTNRFYQTATALIGCDTLLTFFSLPAMSSVFVSPNPSIPSIIILGVILWSWAITGHILRHSLSISIFLGLCLSTAYLFLAYKVMGYMFSVAE